jgi:hypothetical protein
MHKRLEKCFVKKVVGAIFRLQCVALLCLSCTLSCGTSKPVKPPFNQNLPNKDSRNVDLSFKSVAFLDGTERNGIQFSNHVYQASDCVMLSERIQIFKSSARAVAELKKNVSEAHEILERGPKIGVDEKTTEERVKLVLGKEPTAKRYAALWTHQSELHSVESASLPHIEAFEKWIALETGAKEQIVEASRREAMTFEPKSSLDGTTKEGISFSEQQFNSTQCVVVARRIERFRSAPEAKRAFHNILQGADDTIENAPSVKDETSGERAVLFFAPDPKGEFQYHFLVVWTENSNLHSIRANSLPHALEFEKRMVSD